MKNLLGRVLAVSTLVFAAQTSFAQSAGTTTAPAPRSVASEIRVAPVLESSSFANSTQITLENFDEGLTAGLLADFGNGPFSFETGVLTLPSKVNRTGETSAVTVGTWGIPLLAKWNFSGKPHETVFLKVGAMPFTATGDLDRNFNVMGVGGIGANIPLGQNSSILLDAAYNRLFTNSGDLTNYQGISLLAGLSLNI